VVDEADEEHKKKIDEELKRMFRPEILNRVEAVVVFKSRTTSQIGQIVDLQLQRLGKRLADSRSRSR
jgi:ATP-dependent Clp protease ATP-binding subunit ClpA